MTRLYVPHFSPQNSVQLQADQVHYVRHVLRHQVGDVLNLFNASEGEWTARIDKISKSEIWTQPLEQVRGAQSCPPVHLIFSLLKHDALLFLIEKATELGVSHLHPVITQRTVVHRFNAEKAMKNVVDATQQCERFAPPRIAPLTPLLEKITYWAQKEGQGAQDMPIISFLERRTAPGLSEILQPYPPQTPLAFLVGPEGGFTPGEQEWLAARTHNAHLGPRILRAETAALAALTAYQLYVGDF